MENRYKTMVAGKFDFGFAVDWMRKDLGIVLDEARDSGAQAAAYRAGRSVLRRGPGDGRPTAGIRPVDRATGEEQPAPTAWILGRHLAISASASSTGALHVALW